MLTAPVVPSTSMRAPSGIARVAPVTETAHGMPSSRLTITAWLSRAPTSTTDTGSGNEQGSPRRVGYRRHNNVAWLKRGWVM